MRFRNVFLTLFLLPLFAGLVYFAKGASVPDTVECPGLLLGEDGEEHGVLMRPGDRSVCHLYDYPTARSTGSRDYEEQATAQADERIRDYQLGAAFAGYGVTGLFFVVSGLGPWRGSKAAVAVRADAGQGDDRHREEP
ncbi:hypothetical protein [Streptomyces sp. NPDC095613]|uniref:hypothetical protein n=1 Tax=Streptomyces sp. NPDC095613 TaxID=3155540 RepID=UPI00332DE31F